MKATDKNCFRSQGGCVIDMDATSTSRRRKKRPAVQAGPLQVEAAPPKIETQTAAARYSRNDFFCD